MEWAAKSSAWLDPSINNSPDIFPGSTQYSHRVNGFTGGTPVHRTKITAMKDYLLLSLAGFAWSRHYNSVRNSNLTVYGIFSGSSPYSHTLHSSYPGECSIFNKGNQFHQCIGCTGKYKRRFTSCFLTSLTQPTVIDSLAGGGTLTATVRFWMHSCAGKIIFRKRICSQHHVIVVSSSSCPQAV